MLSITCCLIQLPRTHAFASLHCDTCKHHQYSELHQLQKTLSRKERNSNLELYRIIVMLLIVAHHYVVNSGLMSVMKEEPLHIHSIFLYLFGMWGKTGINCFVMITGYFMYKSHISLRKFMKLLFEIYFYSLIITGTFLLTGYAHPSFSTVFYAWVPIQSWGVNYVSWFVVLYFIASYIRLYGFPIKISNRNWGWLTFCLY